MDDGPVVAHDHEFLHSERASVLSLRCAVIARGRKPVRGAESHEGNLGGRHSPLAHASFEHLVYGGLGGFGGKSCAGFRIVLAAPPVRHDSQRFLEARGLYHSLFSCTNSGRLVTDAFTWDQQASRTFAAELLAPQQALVARTMGGADPARVRSLAEEFQVSAMVIQNQLQNASVTLDDD